MGVNIHNFERVVRVSVLAFAVMPGDNLLLVEDSADHDVLRSELWTTLFRGGYMMGKLQRSLSGKFVSDMRKWCWVALILELTEHYSKKIKKYFEFRRKTFLSFGKSILCTDSKLVWSDIQEVVLPIMKFCFIKFMCFRCQLWSISYKQTGGFICCGMMWLLIWREAQICSWKLWKHNAHSDLETIESHEVTDAVFFRLAYFSLHKCCCFSHSILSVQDVAMVFG